MEENHQTHFHTLDSHRSVRHVLWIGIAVDTALSALKIIAGLAGQSNALLADGLHSFSDLISSLVVIIGFRIAFKPADTAHPYGHGRAESIASWVVALLLLVLGAGMAVKAIGGLASGVVSQPHKFTLWAVLFSIVAKEGMFRYKLFAGRKLQSLSLIADAWHHRSDALSSLVALVGIAGAIFGGVRWRFLDHLAAFAVAIIIVHVAVKILRESASELMDTMPSEDIINRFRSFALKIEGVRDTEKIVARKSGLDLLIDIHVEVDKDMTVEESHRVGQRVRDKIMENMPNVKKVLVHIEPFHPNDH